MLFIRISTCVHDWVLSVVLCVRVGLKMDCVRMCARDGLADTASL